MNAIIQKLDNYIDSTIRESWEKEDTLSHLILFYKAMDNVRNELLADNLTMQDKIEITARYKILFKYYLEAGADVHPKFLERIISIHTGQKAKTSNF